jgi:hypothetical protein
MGKVVIFEPCACSSTDLGHRRVNSRPRGDPWRNPLEKYLCLPHRAISQGELWSWKSRDAASGTTSEPGPAAGGANGAGGEAGSAAGSPGNPQGVIAEFESRSTGQSGRPANPQVQLEALLADLMEPVGRAARRRAADAIRNAV